MATNAIEDDDPIVATYRVFIKPPLPPNRKLLVFQYVNKTSQDPAHIRAPRITELRIKPDTGMYEVDVPVDTSESYDRGKGMAWGQALQKSLEQKKGGSLGLAGGFGIGGSTTRTGGRRAANDEDAQPLSWAEAIRQDKVLRTQTLGGGRSAEEENTRHMVGVFQGKNIHLTPVSTLVHLRPIQHHLDAATEQERLARPVPGGAPPPGAAGKEGGRAIHMTLKAAMDDDGVATETMADRLNAVQKEPWKKMEWVHDESEAAWMAYSECLLLHPPNAAGAEGMKGKEVAAEETRDDDLVEKVVKLQTDWGEDELLRAVSGIQKGDKKPGEEAVSQPGASALAKRLPQKGKGKEVAIKTEPQTGEPKRRPGRPPKAATTAATTAATRGTRARAGGTATDAMEVDG
ncbi:Sin-like protein conserved region-domain-containing protein [Diplogelasinospora grovesii]|uniref:Sin-like protein conserved region-domain-containing protein n=1 Tax=Diplogelasinospora grovesii TaxID=303347 RepID=A0AAN6NCP8_9PEZI|nr:Sin-like protein conserved region-domain-containing protein [Diplogelasinospora grovesii]